MARFIHSPSQFRHSTVFTSVGTVRIRHQLR